MKPGKKSRIHLKLAQKLSLLVICMVLLSVIVSVLVSGNWYISQMMESIRENTLNVVNITAQSPIIIDGLQNGDPDKQIQEFVQRTQHALKQIDVIVVADISGIRYGHTVDERVGELFSAEDHADAILRGETYVSIGPGTLGDSLRAFTPVKNTDGVILGFVMAGTLLDSIARARKMLFLMMLGFIAIGFSVGILGAVFLSRYIKRILLSHEPEDIARLYLENQGILETIYEGIIAIDQEGIITLINDTAKHLLDIEDDGQGREISKLFPLSRLPEVVKNGQPALDVTYALKDRLVLSNNLPIRNEKGEIVGGVCSFRDQTEMNRLAEEMTGVKKLVDSLRATTHEFKNKLHVILGFAEMGQDEKITEFIGGITDELQNTISFVLNNIHDPTIAALFIGKGQRAAELKIGWLLDDDCYFENRGKWEINSLVVIIGNLIDNALEHLDNVDQDEKWVRVLINDEEKKLIIRVEDNGNGIAEPERVFEKGYSTKEGSRGYGLALTREHVDKLGGKISFSTEEGEGSMFEVTVEI